MRVVSGVGFLKLVKYVLNPIFSVRVDEPLASINVIKSRFPICFLLRYAKSSLSGNMGSWTHRSRAIATRNQQKAHSTFTFPL